MITNEEIEQLKKQLSELRETYSEDFVLGLKTGIEIAVKASQGVLQEMSDLVQEL